MKKIKLFSNKNGFSLIEIIFYLAIFTMVSILVIKSFVVILSSSSSINSNHRLLDSGTIAMDRISYEIRKASSVDVSNSSFGVDSGYIRLNDVNGTDYVDFTKTGSSLIFSKTNSNLLSSGIYVNKLIFKRIQTTNSEAVKVEMELQDVRSKTIKKEKFYNTIILKGGYN